MPNLNERINNWLQRYYLFVTLLVVGLLILATVNWLLLPEYNRLVEADSGEYENLSNTIEQHRGYLEDLKTMERNYAMVDERVMRIVDSIVPATYAEGPVFASIQDLFKDSQFVVQSINVAPDTTPVDATTAADPFQAVSVSINLQGQKDANYADFKELLRKIELNPQVMNLDSLTYTPGSNAFTFVLHTFQRNSLITSNANATTQP